MGLFKIFPLNVLEGPDFVKLVVVDGKKMCAVKHANRVYVTQAYCPHAGGVLAGGRCKDGKLICPIHRYEYDLESGKGAPGQYDYIDVYQVETKSDGIYVKIEEKRSLWNKLFR